MIPRRQPITSICISLTSTILLVGTAEGSIHLYDVPSHQLLRTISSHKGLSIAHLETMIKPPDLIGHTSLELRPGSAADVKDFIPLKPVAPFQRMRDLKARDAHEVSALLPVGNIVRIFHINSCCFALLIKIVKAYIDESADYDEAEFLQDYNFFFQPQASSQGANTDPSTLKSQVSTLEAEVESLRQQLSKAKGINDAMWDTVVNRLVSQEKDAEHPSKEPEESDQAERRRKRSRPA